VWSINVYISRVSEFQNEFILNKYYFMSVLNPSTPAFQPLSQRPFVMRPPEILIENVWNYNFVEEIRKLANLIDKYPYVAMDTEFPGIILRAYGDMRDLQYQTIRANVDRLKIIQVGITLSDENGNFPPGVCSWQFNFKFDLERDTYSHDSIQLLKDSGIDFKLHKENGIEMQEFAEYFLISGLVLNDDVSWITFHSGYDFAYLLKVLTCQNLPDTEVNFLKTLKLYFPNFYDLKHIVRNFEHLRGGLNKLAEELEVRRVGRTHQAGSDSLVTLSVFFKVKALYFNTTPIEENKCVIYGLNGDPTPSFVNHSNP
jgi:CCR4-NOT transcription complex subunit 7/8